MAAVKAAAEKEEKDEYRSTGSSPATSQGHQVPKLNLAPVLQQQQEEAAQGQVYRVAADVEEEVDSASTDGPIGSKKTPEPTDHYYFYPKQDPKEERKTLEVISKLPKNVSAQMRKIYDDMVMAKQNCEAIAFRGHRLLDQLKSHMEDRLNQASAREKQLIIEMQQLEIQRLQATIELSKTEGRYKQAGAAAGVFANDADVDQMADGARFLSSGADAQVMQEMLQLHYSVQDSRRQMDHVYQEVNQISSRLNVYHPPATSTSTSVASIRLPIPPCDVPVRKMQQLSRSPLAPGDAGKTASHAAGDDMEVQGKPMRALRVTNDLEQVPDVCSVSNTYDQ